MVKDIRAGERRVNCPLCNKELITRAEMFFRHCGKGHAVLDNLSTIELQRAEETREAEPQTAPQSEENALIIVKQEQPRDNATLSGETGDLTSPVSPELDKKEGAENPLSLNDLEKDYKWKCETCNTYFNEFKDKKFCPNCGVQLRE
jgi:predicted RNA-binding Zn-ribbon protein involved in translation (DUF1610 family)